MLHELPRYVQFILSNIHLIWPWLKFSYHLSETYKVQALLHPNSALTGQNGCREGIIWLHSQAIRYHMLMTPYSSINQGIQHGVCTAEKQQRQLVTSVDFTFSYIFKVKSQKCKIYCRSQFPLNSAGWAVVFYLLLTLSVKLGIWWPWPFCMTTLRMLHFQKHYGCLMVEDGDFKCKLTCTNIAFHWRTYHSLPCPV